MKPHLDLFNYDNKWVEVTTIMGTIERGLAHYAGDYDQLWLTNPPCKPNEGSILFRSEILNIRVIDEHE